jgi:PAS domain S-box-containing protein
MREIRKRLSLLYIDVPALRPGSSGAYALALVSVGVALVLRLAVDPYVVGNYFALFYPAILITTLIGGFGAGLFCFALSAVSVWFFLLPPRFSFCVYDPAEVVIPLLLFTLAALFGVTLITWLRSMVEHWRADQANKDRLQFALDAALLGLWQYDPHRRVTLVDARFKEIFDLTTDEIPIEEIKKLVHPDDAERFWADRLASLDPVNPDRSAHQYRIQRRDGEVGCVEVHWLAHGDGFRGERGTTDIIGIGVVHDVTERKRGEEALARLAAIVTSSADAIIGKTLDGIVTTWNEAAERLFGYSAGEMIGQSIRRLVPADRQAEEDMILAHVAKSEAIANYETRRRTRDGRIFDASVTISPLRDAGGRIIGAATIIRDITAHKRAEDQVRLLMREATHRAKNMLSLVLAIARQTASQQPADFLRRFTERVQALAANQDLLVRNEWKGAVVEDLIRTQLAHFVDLVGSRIALHGPKLRLNATAAQAIGLALHELATNAAKYGALSTDGGLVDIFWGTDGDTLTMSWREHGGPPVSPPEQRGFGNTVTVSMVKMAVGGEVQLDYAPSGLVWRSTCPAANVLEQDTGLTKEPPERCPSSRKAV